MGVSLCSAAAYKRRFEPAQIAKPEELNLEEDGRRQSRKGLRKGKGQGRVAVS